jgi:hypothetical protein
VTDRLAYIDQATYLSWAATGRGQLAQYVWVYDRAVDMAGLRRFHENLQHGRGSRLIEPSILPFGRHRWVAAPIPQPAFEVADVSSPSALAQWAEDRSQVAIDPVHGPGWHLAVLPMTDGTTAVSLVLSHCLMDGGAAIAMVVDAVRGVRTYDGFRPPRSRKPLASLRSDAGQVARDLPELCRTVGTAARFAYARRADVAASRSRFRTPPSGPDSAVVLPAVSAIIDTADWDGRAAELGGTSYSLLAGFAAVLGERFGRGRPGDGTISLLIAISDRDGPEDRRANAMKIASAELDPTAAPSDLGPARDVIRAALQRLRDDADEKHALLPITPFVPKRAVARTADVVFGDLPVSCSNLGDVPPEVIRPDGTDAVYVMFKPVEQGVRRHALESIGGQLVVAAGRVAGSVSIGVVGYVPGAPNDREWLCANVVDALAEFDLKGTVI